MITALFIWKRNDDCPQTTITHLDHHLD